MNPQPVYVNVGDTTMVELPYSEVCMHMRIAGQCVNVEILPNRMAQILNPDGTRFSLAITLGEAGIYTDADGRHYHY